MKMATQNTDVKAPVKEVKEDVPMIAHRERYVDKDGVQQDRWHGPMPVSEWAAYEKENGL